MTPAPDQNRRQADRVQALLFRGAMGSLPVIATVGVWIVSALHDIDQRVTRIEVQQELARRDSEHLDAVEVRLGKMETSMAMLTERIDRVLAVKEGGR